MGICPRGFRKEEKKMANYGFTTSYTEVAKISKNITEWMAAHGDKVNAIQMMLDAQCITGARAEKYLRIARRLGTKCASVMGIGTKTNAKC